MKETAERIGHLEKMVGELDARLKKVEPKEEKAEKAKPVEVARPPMPAAKWDDK